MIVIRQHDREIVDVHLVVAVHVAVSPIVGTGGERLAVVRQDDGQIVDIHFRVAVDVAGIMSDGRQEKRMDKPAGVEAIADDRAGVIDAVSAEKVQFEGETSMLLRSVLLVPPVYTNP